MENTNETLNQDENSALHKTNVSRSPIYGLFRFDDDSYVGYWTKKENAEKVLEEEYNSSWYVDEMVCQDCD